MLSLLQDLKYQSISRQHHHHPHKLNHHHHHPLLQDIAHIRQLKTRWM
jgi:hypothetical protein